MWLCGGGGQWPCGGPPKSNGVKTPTPELPSSRVILQIRVPVALEGGHPQPPGSMEDART